MELPIFPFTLEPQAFTDSADNPETVLKPYDFFSEFEQLLPDVYINAQNFMEIVRQIADTYQYLYDVMRSLVNVPNFSFSNYLATGQSCSGVYLLMLARFLDIPISYTQINNENQPIVAGVDDQILATNILTKIVLMNSRGTHKDFEDYYLAIDNYSQFIADNISEDIDGTLKLNTSFTNDSTTRNVTLAQFEKDITNLKAVGVRINDNRITLTPRIFTFSYNPNPYNGTTIDYEGDKNSDYGNFGKISGDGKTILGQALFKR